MKHKIPITQEHIDDSTPGSHSDNPILKALGDVFPDSIFVVNSLAISENNTRTNELNFYHVPDALTPFNVDFNAGKEVMPITFSLEEITPEHIAENDTRVNG